jgi:hypothetical protein
MLAADDGKPATLATMHEVTVRWNDPNDSPDAGAKVYPTMNPVVVAEYQTRRKAEPSATAPMPARADIRFGFDANGEIFILSKVDGMIRSVVAATAGN